MAASPDNKRQVGAALGGRVRLGAFANAVWLALFAAFTTVAAAQEPACPLLTPAQYQLFVDITFVDEDGRDIRDFAIRWQTDVRIEVQGAPSGDYRTILEDVVEDLSDLIASVSVGFVEEGGNFIVHYAPIETFGEIIRSWGAPPGDLSTACAMFYYWRRDGEIVEVRVLLPTNAAAHGCGTRSGSDYLLSATREEVTQAFGFPNDVYGDRTSIFDQYGDPEDYSPTDRLMIRALYCADTRAGMTEVALWPVLVADSVRLSSLLQRAGVIPMTSEDIVALQSLLTDLGYKFGPIDGELSSATLAAAADARARFEK
jgi:hypothetical protein